jgi:hypothetical protein
MEIFSLLLNFSEKQSRHFDLYKEQSHRFMDTGTVHSLENSRELIGKEFIKI